MTDAPKRIQLRRTKGWRKPPNTVVVSRPSKWGNPIDPTNTIACESNEDAAWMHQNLIRYGDTVPYPRDGQTDRLMRHRDWVLDHADELIGKNLACWCPLDAPCHADELLELARHRALASTS